MFYRNVHHIKDTSQRTKRLNIYTPNFMVNVNFILIIEFKPNCLHN